jgi:hypothetical protein
MLENRKLAASFADAGAQSQAECPVYQYYLLGGYIELCRVPSMSRTWVAIGLKLELVRLMNTSVPYLVRLVRAAFSSSNWVLPGRQKFEFLYTASHPSTRSACWLRSLHSFQTHPTAQGCWGLVSCRYRRYSKYCRARDEVTKALVNDHSSIAEFYLISVNDLEK